MKIKNFTGKESQGPAVKKKETVRYHITDYLTKFRNSQNNLLK